MTKYSYTSMIIKKIISVFMFTFISITTLTKTLIKALKLRQKIHVHAVSLLHVTVEQRQ